MTQYVVEHTFPLSHHELGIKHMKWLKYREVYREGPGQWQWKLLTTGYEYANFYAEEWVRERREALDWNVGFRKIEWEIADPPRDVLEREAKRYRIKIKSAQVCLAAIEARLNDMDEVSELSDDER